MSRAEYDALVRHAVETADIAAVGDADPQVCVQTAEGVDKLLGHGRFVADPPDAAGAIVLFLGTTREITDGRRTAWLDYECYPEMARAKLSELEEEARRRWGLVECLIVHRLGRVPIGEASVAVAVSAPHRGEAFAAGQWLIDTLKDVVPIWKQEHWSDGTSEWVHPGVESNQTAKTAPDATRTVAKP
jgi:molybdopterin synthase catalytic subunit